MDPEPPSRLRSNDQSLTATPMMAVPERSLVRWRKAVVVWHQGIFDGVLSASWADRLDPVPSSTFWSSTATVAKEDFAFADRATFPWEGFPTLPS
jgi:hypothetical protein